MVMGAVDALTGTFSLPCPAYGTARVRLSAFRQIERLGGAAHPAVYRVTFQCGCGDEHVALIGHDAHRARAVVHRVRPPTMGSPTVCVTSPSMRTRRPSYSVGSSRIVPIRVVPAQAVARTAHRAGSSERDATRRLAVDCGTDRLPGWYGTEGQLPYRRLASPPARAAALRDRRSARRR